MSGCLSWRAISQRTATRASSIFASAFASMAWCTTSHLVVVPFFDRHSAVNIINMICRIMDVLCPVWRHKLLSVTFDGKNLMTGCHASVVMHLQNEATYNVLRV